MLDTGHWMVEAYDTQWVSDFLIKDHTFVLNFKVLEIKKPGSGIHYRSSFHDDSFLGFGDDFAHKGGIRDPLCFECLQKVLGLFPSHTNQQPS